MKGHFGSYKPPVVAIAVVTVALCLCSQLTMATMIEGVIEQPLHGGEYPEMRFTSGWVMDYDNIDQALTVRVSIDGQPPVEALADHYVAHLGQLYGEPNAYHGFQVPLPTLEIGPHLLVVEVVDPDSGVGMPFVEPVHFAIVSGLNRFTSPPYGVPVGTRFSLTGILMDPVIPERTVMGKIEYFYNDTVHEIPFAADLPTDGHGNHGFAVEMTLEPLLHWYINLYADTSYAPGVPEWVWLDFLNLDTICPPANAGPDQAICAGEQVMIGWVPPELWGEPGTWSWWPTDGLADPTEPRTAASPAETTTYTLTVTDPGGFCSYSDSVTVTVDDSSVHAEAEVNCVTDGATAPVVLSAGYTGAGTGLLWQWDIDDDGLWDFQNLSDPAIVVDRPIGLNRSVVRVQGTTDDCLRDVVEYTVDQQVTATVSGDATVCEGESATLNITLTGAAPWNVTWSDGVSETYAGSPATRQVSPAETTVYSITAVDDSGECSGATSGSATVTVEECGSGEPCAPRTVGYWSQQFDGNAAQKEDACDYLAELEQSSGVFFEAMPAASDRCAQIEAVLVQWGGDTMWRKAVRQLLALQLNVISGKVDGNQTIDLDYSESTTVDLALAEIEAILRDTNSSHQETERAKDLADDLNNSCGFDPPCVDSCTPTPFRPIFGDALEAGDLRHWGG